MHNNSNMFYPAFVYSKATRLHNSDRSFMRRVRTDIAQKRACRILRFCPTEQGSKKIHKSKYFHAATRGNEVWDDLGFDPTEAKRR